MDRDTCEWGTSRRSFLGLASLGAAALTVGVGSVGLAGIGTAAAVTPWTAVPLVLNLSDGVAPGELFRINGEGVGHSGVSVVAARAAAATPPSGAIPLAVVQTDVERGQFAVVRAPQLVGAYHLWIQNAAGWSAAVAVNAARPLYLSQAKSRAGLHLSIVGRNLDPSEFGSAELPLVQLVPAGEGPAVPARVVDANPYKIDVVTPNAPSGTHHVEVSTDGVTWRRPANGRLLEVVGGPRQDPLRLGVWWAGAFAASTHVPAEQHGATVDDGSDDTVAVQQAIDAAKAAGGGTVWLPEGRLLVKQLKVPAGIVLRGHGDQSQLAYNGTGEAMIISDGDGATVGQQAFVDFSIELAGAQQPAVFLSLGNPWSPAESDHTLRTTSQIAVKGVTINYPKETAPSGAVGIGMRVVAKSDVLITQNHWVGYRGAPQRLFVNEYLTMSDNYFGYADGVVTTVTQYSLVERNTLDGPAGWDHPGKSHGLSSKGNIYVADNIVRNMGQTTPGSTSGEALLTEPTGRPGPVHAFNSFGLGQVVSATPTTITVAPLTPMVSLPPIRVSTGYHVLIIDGRGLGQLRNVTGLDPVTNVVTVSEPWTVLPDASSRFSIAAIASGTTYFRNHVEGNTKGIWLYGQTYDSVVAANESVDSEGIFLFNQLYKPEIRQRFFANHFVKIEGNLIEGVARGMNTGHIDTQMFRDPDQEYYGVAIYGVEVIGNSIIGNRDVVPVRIHEAVPISGFLAGGHSFAYGENGTHPGDQSNTILSRNEFRDLNVAITLDRPTYGTVIEEPSYVNVGTQLQDQSSNVVVV